MPNEKLLWLVLVTSKKQNIESIDIDKLNTIAQSFNYNAKFVILTNNNVLPSTNLENINLSETGVNYSIKVYDKKVKVNTQIMKEFENVTYDKVMVTNAFYCNNFDVLTQMLEKSTEDEVDIVHLTKKRLGFYGELTNTTKSLYNKVVKMFTNGADKFYIRNCVIFNRLILEIMQDFPNKSSAIRETTIALGVNTESIVVDNKFKTPKLNLSTFSQLIASIGVCILSLAIFVIICAVRMDIDILLWLIVACIATAVAGVIFLNYAILKEKISIDNFNLEKTKLITPLFSQSFNEKVEKSEGNQEDNKTVENVEDNQNDEKINEVASEVAEVKKAKPKSKSTSSAKSKTSTKKKSSTKSSTQTKTSGNKSKSSKTTAKKAKKRVWYWQLERI